MARIPPLSGSALSSRLAALEARVDAPGLMSVTATGATTARSLAERFADVVNVKDYGALGGGANDTAAVQSAANAALSSGAQLVFPAGTFDVETILLGNGGGSSVGLTIRGDSAGRTTIRSRTGATVFEMTGAAAHTISFRDLQILGQGPSVGVGHGIYIHDNDFDDHMVRLEGVRIVSMGGKGIYLPSTFNVKMDTVLVSNCGSTGIEGRFDVCASFINCYAGKVLAGQYGYHIYKGNPVFIGCNGLDNASEDGASWGRFGQSLALDGVDNKCYPVFIGSNFEAIRKYGVHLVYGSWANFLSCVFVSPASNPVAPVAIQYDGQDPAEYPLEYGKLDSQCRFANAGAGWLNGYPIHSDGVYVPLVTEGLNNWTDSSLSRAYLDNAATTADLVSSILYLVNATEFRARRAGDVLTLLGRATGASGPAAVRIGNSNTVTSASQHILGIYGDRFVTLKAGIDKDGNFENLTAGEGVILKAPNGTRYKLTVSDAGAAVWTEL